MSGFQVWNQAGALTVDSDNRHTVVNGQFTPTYIDVGAYGGATPFGDWKQLGYLHPNYYPKANQLTWFRLAAGAWCFPGAWLFQPGTVQMITTSRVLPLQSGYLDVFDANGNLIWSAMGASDMPRVMDILNITSAPNNVVSGINLSYSPWICLGPCPGNFSYDGETRGFCGLLFKWTGGTLQWCWVQEHQMTFDQVYGGKGGRVTIPLAIFNGR